MKCPIDQTTLAITERQGIEIDYCPQCRGVWLDRGELDKMIEAGGAARPAAPPERDTYQTGAPTQQYRSDANKYKKQNNNPSSDLCYF